MIVSYVYVGGVDACERDIIGFGSVCADLPFVS